jgi:hypothetical protein
MSYTVKTGARMNANLHAAAGKIAALLPFNITITSGVRDAREQAQAMFTKIRSAGTTQILIEDYKDDSFAQGVIDAWNNGENLQQATEFVQGYFDLGKGSSHGRGDALDIRTTGGTSNRLSSSEIAAVIQATKDLGYAPYQEYSPPHIHVKVGSDNAKKNSLLLMAMVGIGLWIFLS